MPTTPTTTSPDGLAQAAECLRTLAHPLRLRLLQLLLQDDYPVGALAEACNIPSHIASEHLGKMRDRRLLRAERRGRQTFYKITDPYLQSIMDCIEKRFE